MNDQSLEQKKKQVYQQIFFAFLKGISFCLFVSVFTFVSTYLIFQSADLSGKQETLVSGFLIFVFSGIWVIFDPDRRETNRKIEVWLDQKQKH